MKKTILSLSAVLAMFAMFASVPAIYATPVVGSASEASVSSIPSVNIDYLPTSGTTMPDEIRRSTVFDASFAAEKVDPEYDALQKQGKVPYKSCPTHIIAHTRID